MNHFQLQKFTSADRAALIASARRRLLIYAPGLGPAEIAAVEDVVAYLPEVETHLYLDVSPTSFRAGYWHGQPVQALNTLRNGPVRIYQSVGARLGLLVVDDQAISFTPPLPRVELDAQGFEANAILYSPEMTELLWNSIVVGAVPAEITTDDTPAVAVEITPVPVRSVLTPADISRVAEMQRNTPPIEPDRERLVDRLRSQFKLVHISVQGYKLQNRTLGMHLEVTEILGSISREINQHLHTSWRLFTDMTENDPDFQKLEQQRKNLEEITRKHLKPLGHFGSGLLVRELADFQGNIAALESVLEEMRCMLDKKLPEYIQKSRQRLIDLILERARDKQVQLPEPNLSLFDANLSEQDRQRLAAEQVADAINWPSPNAISEEIKCQYSIDDVTLHHLQQESFRKAFRKAYKFDIDDLLGV